MSIASVGEVTALTWALGSGRAAAVFVRSGKRSVTADCVVARRNPPGKTHRGPLSKQRNRHLQTVLIEAAKLAPRFNSQLAQVHAKAIAQGASRNRATLEVARKLVAYLLAVDKSGQPFEVRSSSRTID